MKKIVFQFQQQVIGPQKMVRKLINNLNELFELRSQNNTELHVTEVKERSNRLETENRSYNFAGFDHFKSEILAKLRRVKYKELEDMVYRMGLTYDEIVDILDIK